MLDSDNDYGGPCTTVSMTFTEWQIQDEDNTVSSSFHHVQTLPKQTSQHLHAPTTLLHTLDGGVAWDLSSEDDSDCSKPPRKKVCKHGRRDTVKLLHTSDGGELWDFSEEDYSYSEDE